MPSLEFSRRTTSGVPIAETARPGGPQVAAEVGHLTEIGDAALVDPLEELARVKARMPQATSSACSSSGSSSSAMSMAGRMHEDHLVKVNPYCTMSSSARGCGRTVARDKICECNRLPVIPFDTSNLHAVGQDPAVGGRNVFKYAWSHARSWITVFVSSPSRCRTCGR